MKRKQRTDEVQSIDIDGLNLAEIRKLLDRLQEDHGEKYFELYLDVSSYDHYTDIKVMGKRMETEEEAERREKADKIAEARQREWELSQLKRLQAKYSDRIDVV